VFRHNPSGEALGKVRNFPAKELLDSGERLGHLDFQVRNDPDRQIHIQELEIFVHIGVPEEERRAPQRLTASISFWPYHEAGELADKIENAVNYSAVVEETKNFVRDQSVSLIETLADRLATHLLKRFRMQKVTIELRKFPFEDTKYVSVTITRTASAG
jgi:7,8-dihydroneopterin aldolase/epimerase/oxygenase